MSETRHEIRTHERCYNGWQHKIDPIFHWSHEHEQWGCRRCGIRFTPLSLVEKEEGEPESYIARTMKFFRWKI